MNPKVSKPVLAIGGALLAAVAVHFESSPVADSLNTASRAWLGANAISSDPERVAEILVESTGASSIGSIEAGMILRALQRLDPEMVVFLDPIFPDARLPILESRMVDFSAPIVFTASASATVLPRVDAPGANEASHPELASPGGSVAGAQPPAMSAGMASLVLLAGETTVASNLLEAEAVDAKISAESVTGRAPGRIHLNNVWWPLNRDGTTNINPIVDDWVEQVDFADLMFRVEQAEHGLLSPILDRWFRGRTVGVRLADSMGNSGAALAAARNRLFDVGAPDWVPWMLVLFAGLLPWVPSGRGARSICAWIATVAWLLFSVGLYNEFRMTVPVVSAFVLPLFAAVLPLPITRKSAPHPADR